MEDSKATFDLQRNCDPVIYLFWHARFWLSESLKEARQLLFSIEKHSFPPGLNGQGDGSKFEEVLKNKYFDSAVLLPNNTKSNNMAAAARGLNNNNKKKK